MTTVVSPASSPIPVYNRSGETIVSLTGGNVSSGNPIGNDGVSIPRYSGRTVALMTPQSGADGFVGVVVLPSDAEIGDVVEVFCVAESSGSGMVAVFPPVSSSIGVLSASTGTDSSSYSAVQIGQGRIYRLVSSTNWQGTTGGSGSGN